MKCFIEKERRMLNVGKTVRKHFGNEGGLKHTFSSVNKTSMSMTQQQAKLSTLSLLSPAENAQ